MDTSSRIHFLFEKYLQRNCSPQEIEELFYLLEEPGAEESLNPQMRSLWEEIKNDQIRYKVDWKKMYSAVVNSEKQTDVIINRATAGKRWIAYAGTAALLILFALPVYWYLSRKPSIQAGDTISTITNKNEPALKDRQTIHLPDGSSVILNTGSKLNYPSAFDKKHRDVYLTGEGFFDIKHNAAKPFYVHVGNITIKVLGTAFNIKATPQQDNVEVTVTRGKVQVLKENKVLGTLVASEQISLNNISPDVIKKTVDTIPVIAWKPAEIFLDDITMQEAAEKLEQRFSVKIEFANPAIKQCRVSATFSEDDMVDEILTVLCAVSNANFRTVEGKTIIEGKGCN